MSKEAMQNVPRGLVRSLTTRWQVNDDTGDVDDAQRPARAGRSTGVRPRRNLPQLHNGFFQEILGRVYGELEVAGFTLEQEHAGTPSQTSNIMSVQVLSTDHSHMHVILKSINFASPKARVSMRCWLPLNTDQMKLCG
ncbi:hypothetical protein L798_06950 [Zootermopsis nevadensis]|uniref:Uncharacterized protein n=1 Tax=Zootermopsis nevadensis TaxID=136037 RepID=A0A067RGG6_ZOONE|nr:hypothetical protein L798_06950 [Zootermopsis nevadensis]